MHADAEAWRDPSRGSALRMTRRAGLSMALVLLFASAAYADDTPWEVYLDHPTSENATRVRSLDYTPGTKRAARGYELVDLLILDQQIRSGDVEVLELAIRVARTTKAAATSEYLHSFVGASIRGNPVLFLTVAKQQSLTPRALHDFVLFGAEYYVDRFSAQTYELQMRRRALAAVDHPSLIPVRDSCVRILSEALEGRPSLP